MTGPWKPWKTKRQVSHASHSPLEIANIAIPTFPQRRPRVVVFRTPKRPYARALRALAMRFTIEERSDPRHPNQHRIHFPFQAHAALESNPTFRLIARWNQNPISGSFLDWKMLIHPYFARRCAYAASKASSMNSTAAHSVAATLRCCMNVGVGHPIMRSYRKA